MCVFNGEKFVSKAIESILNQTLKNFEFIIVDDGSTDNTVDILTSYQDPRIKIISQKNIGLTASLNKAIKIAQGKFIARLDADEVSIDYRLEKQVAFLLKNENVGVVGSQFINIDKNGKRLYRSKLPLNDSEIRKELLKQNQLAHGSVMIRKEVFNIVGYYNETFRYVQDYELWGRIAKKYNLYNFSEVLLLRSVTSTSLSQQPHIKLTRAFYSLKAQYFVQQSLGASIIKKIFLAKGILYFCYCLSLLPFYRYQTAK